MPNHGVTTDMMPRRERTEAVAAVKTSAALGNATAWFKPMPALQSPDRRFRTSRFVT